MLYVAKTRPQAKRIFWKDVMKDINRRYKVGMHFNQTDLEITFPTETKLYLIGVDTSPDEAEKAFGMKWSLVIIDESAFYRTDMKYLVNDVLMPAMADYEGTICLLSSTGNNTSNLFYDITGRAEDDPKRVGGWSRHKWNWTDNPNIRDKMQRMIDRLIAANPKIVDTPGFRQMYMNEWVVDLGKKVYKYDSSKNSAENLPTENEYYHVVGCDLGYEDPTAFVVAAFSDTDKKMYFVEAFKRKHMDLTDVANVLNVLSHKYKPVRYVIDGSSKQAVEELRRRFEFPLTIADRQGKSDIIEIMNSDIQTEKVMVLPAAEGIFEEADLLIWDEDTSKRIESRYCENHLCDAALYTWRKCFHYAATEVPMRRKTVEDEIEEWWDKEGAKVMGKNKDVPGWAKDFDVDVH